MPDAVQSGFQNNISIVTIRYSAAGSVKQHTAVKSDNDGDGTDEAQTVSIIQGEGSKITYTVSNPAGAPRTITSQTTETDGGVNTDGSIYTSGLD